MKRDHKNRIRKDIPVRAVRPDVRQTKTAGGNFVDKIKAYRDLHAHALFSSLGRLVASPFTSIMTIAVLAIAISLASGFYILVVNLQQLTGNLETSNQLSLFLRDDVSDAHANKLADSIRQNENVQDVKIISRKQALTEFQTYSGFGTAINALEENPLPIVIQVLPKNSLEDKQGLEDLLKSFEQSPEVDFAQMDLQWIERLQSIMSVARLFATLLNLMLGGAVLFIIGNTIRLELHTRRDEVVIAKLVGATNGFIRRPFLYTGFWIGFISGVSAWFVVTTLMLVLRDSVEKLSGLYGDSFHLLFLDFTQTLALIGISSALGVLGSWAVLMYQLQHTKSE
ncbi:permease-like cell division protein FtsX [Methylobacter psychrophilus]|uniref:permease-like cell division protein FtsX n=1 Tax=Methylobacter psychrophilus TaxID=96941 RepID=UPI0021D4A49F|nr:permease-like cell division protein FtsX [Methylobacter psychrophilus]